METSEEKIPPKVLQEEAFNLVREWIQVQDEIHVAERRLLDLKGRAAELERNQAVQITKGAIKGAKRRLPSDAPKEVKEKAKAKKTESVRKRLERMSRNSEDRPRNPSQGPKFQGDIILPSARKE
jgi:hypothetical protein